ncbi:MAG: hypothetical protein A3H52_02310 [Candidatus Zambryskibacteria bacterium RIFCSPLOWO2_02_FULL_39_26]|uniref:VTT domain-containing protein n=1 Tax=Candidatus Zambryskibacteria bacterium RIFCSPLOWO2_12_FULL_39_23 TaxID=1802776 RepID=A0A1G2UT98_9BACT|nr:MAG: hypothetical protein A2W51_00685 [Candidatus Zambryskibacteria bacterium RIFCSPHIGHO2_02_39_10]OHA99674.1 MAG: hypothetical protein A3E59_01160 [Candidatus Zambryskibacteria bacterium RIFCSPHIGHO2_12_FULL_39_47]OHB09470.1 MAG: hypothetical protein A3H52_02310 [Candidatus Zambryskibacteria bacterium RIFCSPLOWO2_02_FULL_39_26]OHB12568.1 MAG: hypothetical protein A3G99_01985 [Candidatus Zambryskibacteria bacterium RIFCSPLOWO2_12_FULL_39_23]
MFSNDIFFILAHYKYFVVFPIAVIEGPIITIISGFLAHLGFFSFLFAYITLVLSDITGCTLYYLAGRYWRNSVWIKRRISRWDYNENSKKFLEDHFRKHKVKTIFIAKISHGIGWMVHIFAGVAKVNYFEFIVLNIIGALPKTFVLMLLGYYLGNSYQKIDGYLGYISLTVICLVLLFVIYKILNKYVKNYWKRNEIQE